MNVRKNFLIVVPLALNCLVEIISAEPFLNSSFLTELQQCFETDNDDKCKEIILQTERIQLSEYYKGNLKCQTSILGLQTELIRNIYFKRHKEDFYGRTIPSLIKNCKL